MENKSGRGRRHRRGLQSSWTAVPQPRGRRDPRRRFLRSPAREEEVWAHPAPPNRLYRQRKARRRKFTFGQVPACPHLPAAQNPSASCSPLRLRTLPRAPGVTANGARVPGERSGRHGASCPARSGFPLSWALLQSHAMRPAGTAGISPSGWGPTGEGRTGNDVGTSPTSFNPHARAGPCFPPGTTASSPKPFSCRRTPPSNCPPLTVLGARRRAAGEQRTTRSRAHPQAKGSQPGRSARPGPCGCSSPKALPGPQETPAETPQPPGAHATVPPTARGSERGRVKRHPPLGAGVLALGTT